jgi:hypothetical protein
MPHKCRRRSRTPVTVSGDGALQRGGAEVRRSDLDATSREREDDRRHPRLVDNGPFEKKEGS